MKILLRPRTRKRSAGSAIMEALLTAAIVGTMGAGLIGSFSYGFMAMQMVRENQRATQIILEKVETLRLYNWDQVLTTGFIPASFEEVFDPQAVGDNPVMYHGTVSIVQPSTMSSSYKTDMRELIVTLRWTSVNNQERSRTLSTYIAKDGLQNYVF